ncbi:MAG: hypothetical protein OK456_07310 [Thaumarchaeota archaeon]|nr:hypothetical protein [Nitrososphaerota archaeon]
MSFSSSSGKSRSSGKGSAGKKSTKKKKQEFHTARRKAAKEEQPDLDKIKERTVSALEHLGQQKFSGEPGGYDTKSWVKSLKLLLQDFESKVGEDRLTADYTKEKNEVLENLSKDPDTSEIEGQIESIRKEEVEVKNRLDLETDRVAARIVEVRNENERHSKELESEKSKLEKLNEERKQVSFFSKLVGKKGPSTRPVEDRMTELKLLLASLEAERVSLANARESINRNPTPGTDPYGEDWKRLDEAGKRIGELEAEVKSRMQRSQERADAAERLAKLVSTMPVPSPEAPEADAQES